MTGVEDQGVTADERTELLELRARVVELETLHAKEIARAHAVVADAQNRAYWLDKMNIDLNRFFASAAGQRFWWLSRRVRRVAWALRRLQRRILRWLRIG